MLKAIERQEFLLQFIIIKDILIGAEMQTVSPACLEILYQVVGHLTAYDMILGHIAAYAPVAKSDVRYGEGRQTFVAEGQRMGGILHHILV